TGQGRGAFPLGRLGGLEEVAQPELGRFAGGPPADMDLVAPAPLACADHFQLHAIMRPDAAIARDVVAHRLLLFVCDCTGFVFVPSLPARGSLDITGIKSNPFRFLAGHFRVIAASVSIVYFTKAESNAKNQRCYYGHRENYYAHEVKNVIEHLLLLVLLGGASNGPGWD